MAKISAKYGFSDSSLVERFVMCLEVHKRITGEVGCLVRGGMCMPFHHPDFEVMRMSKDVDISL